MATTTASRKRQTTKTPAVEVTLATFDTQTPVYRAKRTAQIIGGWKPITTSDYRPNGGTPLRDATAKFIAHLDGLRKPWVVTIGLLLDESGSMGGNQMAVIEGVNQFVDGLRGVDAVSPESAGTALAVIVTDGYENSSHEVTQEQLAQTIKLKEADGFTFIFMGANLDAWDAGTAMGFSGGVTGQTVNYVSTPMGTASAFNAVAQEGHAHLSGVSAYHMSRSGTSMRSLTEDGIELASNTGAADGTSAAVSHALGLNWTASQQATVTDVWGDPAEALRRAQENLSDKANKNVDE